MRRARGPRRCPPAAWLFAAALAAGACASGPPPRVDRPTPTPPGRGRAPLTPREGNYHCYVSRQGADEPRVSCRIARAAGGALRLVGTNASTRIDGSLYPIDHRSFRFEGTLVTALEGEAIQTAGPFEAVDVHVYRGPLPTPRGPLWVTVAYVPRPGPRGVIVP